MNVCTPRSTRTRRVVTGAATIALAACGVVSLSQTASAAEVVRIGGSDRIDTALKVWEQNRDLFAGDRVMLTRQDVYADALASAPQADLARTPILVTQSDRLDSRVLAALKRQGIKNVGIVGGTDAISPRVVKTLQDNGMTTARVAGKDRFETARIMSDNYLKAAGKTSAPAFIASGTNFPDALAAGAAAAQAGGYVVLSTNDKLDAGTSAFLKSGKASSRVAVGGPAVTAARRAGISAQTVSGATRYETAVALADRFFDKPANAVIASGQTYADSLAGGALAARLDGPLLLTPPNTTNGATQSYLSKVKPNLYVLGGPAAVSNYVLGELTKAVEDSTPTPTPNPTTPAPSPTAPTPPPAGGGGGSTTSLETVLAPYAGETFRGTASGTSNSGGTAASTSTVTVNDDGSYIVNQAFTVTAPNGPVPLSDTETMTATLESATGEELTLVQTLTWTASRAFDASGSTASAKVQTYSDGTVDVANPTFNFATDRNPPVEEGTTVTAQVSSTLNGAPVGTKSVTLTYTNGTWVRTAAV